MRRVLMISAVFFILFLNMNSFVFGSTIDTDINIDPGFLSEKEYRNGEITDLYDFELFTDDNNIFRANIESKTKYYNGIESSLFFEAHTETVSENIEEQVERLGIFNKETFYASDKETTDNSNKPNYTIVAICLFSAATIIGLVGAILLNKKQKEKE